MNIIKLAGNAIGFVADVLALKVLGALPQKIEALVSRITCGFVTRDACAARSRHNAAALDQAFPFLERLLGQRPSRLIENAADALANSAAARARQFANNLGNLLPDVRENRRNA